MELELPEGTPDFNADKNRIRPSAGEPDQDTWASSSRRVSTEGGMLPTIADGQKQGLHHTRGRSRPAGSCTAATTEGPAGVLSCHAQPFMACACKQTEAAVLCLDVSPGCCSVF